MLNSKYTRTTISIPEDLLFEIKKKALLERKTITEIVNESLSLAINYKTKNAQGKKFNMNSLFGAWGKGTSGLSYLKKVRYDKAEKEREKHLASLWKKS